MTDHPNLKPCPFCGNDAPDIETWTEFDRSYPEPNEYQCESVTCVCGVQRNSIEAWNTRTDLAPKVKDLVWDGLISWPYEITVWEGAGTLHNHAVQEDGQAQILKSAYLSLMGIDELKELASSHHRETILSALTTAPVTPQQAAEVLRKFCADRAGRVQTYDDDIFTSHAEFDVFTAALKAIAKDGE